MKNFIMIFTVLFFIQTSSFAIEEVSLNIDEELPSCEKIEEKAQELTLYEKIQNIKSKEYTDITQSPHLFEEVLTKNFDNGLIDTMHFFGYYRGAVDLNMASDDNDWLYEINSINAGVNGKFKDGKTFYEARLKFEPQRIANFMQYLPSNLYIANTAIPNHTIMFGNTRTPTGVEGGMPLATIPFVSRAQISRNFGNVRKVGLRVKGNYSLIDYDLGEYDSDTYFRSFFPGAEFTGWVNLKPLGKTNGKYGNLYLGGGLSAGQNRTNYCVTGLYAGYEYKNLFANFEYAAANGYNGAVKISTNHAEGFYTTLGYRITPKVQLVARYDQFVPDKQKSDDIRREYSAGINYFIKGQALKIMLNYVFCQNDLLKDSHRIILGTQILL